MQKLLRATRPYIFDLPMHQVPFELLFQITLCGGATDDARQFYGHVVSEIESVVESYFITEKKRKRETEKARKRMLTRRQLPLSPSRFLPLFRPSPTR